MRHSAFLHNVITQLQRCAVDRAVTAVKRYALLSAGWDVPTFTADGQTAEQAAANPA